MATSSDVQREMIIEYWYRKLLSISYSIQHIATIIIEYAKEYDEFEPLLSSIGMGFADDNLTAFFPKDRCDFMLMALGKETANPGYKYNWKIKLIEAETRPNIGITDAARRDM